MVPKTESSCFALGRTAIRKPVFTSKPLIVSPINRKLSGFQVSKLCRGQGGLGAITVLYSILLCPIAPAQSMKRGTLPSLLLRR